MLTLRSGNRTAVLLFGLCAVGIVAAGHPVSAAEAVLRNGNILQVHGYRVDGDWVTLLLDSGGEIALPARHILEIRGEIREVREEAESGKKRPAPPAQEATSPMQSAGSPVEHAPRGPSGDSEIGFSAPDREAIRVLASRVASEHGVDEALVLAVIEVESNYTVDARSPRGAVGLMQLMPGTAQRFSVSDPYDATENLDGGVRYLKELLERYSGEVRLALAAYNAGEEAVERFEGIPPYRETIRYVSRVMKKIGE